MPRFRRFFVIAALACLASTVGAAAQPPQTPVPPPERLCDTQYEDCREPILNLIVNERMGIDVGFWYMQDSRYATALVNAFKGYGRPPVPVRIIVDSRANPTYPGNVAILRQLSDAGIPMREKFGEDVFHNKMMLFHGQNIVQFSKANFDPFAYVPAQPGVNFEDEAVCFTNDDRLTNSFRRRFDDRWVNTTLFRNYANITGPLVRTYPLLPIDPSMNFSSGSGDFSARLISRMDRETESIDAIVFRVTEDRMADAATRAVGRGVPVRLLTEPGEYRNLKRLYDSKEVDRMHMGGVQLKIRQHLGVTHEASVILHALGEVVFGSANWTLASAVYQDEHNFFYNPTLGKPWFFSWFAEQFNGKWNDDTNFVPFRPLPPDPPTYSAPGNGLSGVGSSVTLKWDGGPWSHLYDIYFGTASDPPLLTGNIQLGAPDAGVIETYTINNLLPGTTYYWRIVDRTWAQQTNSGLTWSFATEGTPPNGGGSTPFGGTPWAVPGTIQAEDFDDGGQNVAYFDTSAGNTGGEYRRTEDVDIQDAADSDGVHNVGWTKAGEWLNYTVNVAASGTYLLETRVAQLGAGASFHVEVDGVNRTGSIVVPDTGDWQAWTTISTPGIPLTAGTRVIHLVIDSANSGGGGNYNWLRLSTASPPPPSGNTPFGGTPWAIPGLIQAENFDNGGQNVAYFDTAAGNKGGIDAYRATDVDLQPTSDPEGGGYHIGWTKAGEWVKFTVNIGTTGTYALETRLAQVGSGGSFRVEADGVDLRTIPVPDTGSWDKWQTVTTTGIPLSAGVRVLRVVFNAVGSGGGVGNFNWFRLSTASAPPPPPPPPGNTPFGGTPWAIPGLIQAENFDNGGQNVAYFDTAAGNKGGIDAYRATDVDLQPTSDPEGGGYHIGWTKAGEWVKYTVNVSTSGSYTLETRIANVGVGSFHLDVDGVNRSGSVSVPDTGAWDEWQTVATHGIPLAAGQHVLRVVFDTIGYGGGVGNFNWFRLSMP